MFTATYYKITITETGRNTLKDQPHTFNLIEEKRKTLDGVKEYLIDRYGNIPPRKRNTTMFIDTKDNDSVPIGFIKSFWNKDWSHNSTSWYQTDWVRVSQVTESPVLVN